MHKRNKLENYEVMASCACGNSFKTHSTSKDIAVTVCSACHPFFTGAQKFVDSEGTIDKFYNKYKEYPKKEIIH